ncbi:helicase-related protein [Sphingobium bisphenolivorans]|uniref:helicase-related protein n=1 Tax=Sphingobium bisphenolivorans TaxID=1335760 RepID=UPI00039B5AD4|nr:helicase-related protein [Sphingobium bisphenolivorans]
MSIAWIATRLAGLLERGNILYLADDDQQAERVAAALAALMPGDPVIFLPSSDTLPGDTAPASPSNVGQRVAALHRLRCAKGKVALVMSGEAAARAYPAPEAFESAPPTLAVGDPLVLAELAERLTEIGYFADDRVDEPGEMAVRGDVADIFPADAGTPVRVEVAEKRVASLRTYDPISQRAIEELDGIAIGRALEPTTETAVTILSHIEPGQVTWSAKAEKRRLRFLKLAADAHGRDDRAPQEEWDETLRSWETVALDQAADVPRFAESRSPLASFARFVKPLLEEGRSLILAGCERDLRFLRRKVEKRLGIELAEAADWQAVTALPPGRGATIQLPVDAGFTDDRLVLIAAADLLGSRAIVDDAAPGSGSIWVSASSEVQLGDVIVHEDHGVGLALGLETVPGEDGGETEMIALGYAGGTRRLVRVAEADRIWRYGGDADAVTLDKLDSSSWQKRREAIEQAVASTAEGLAEMARIRTKAKAPEMAADEAAYERFVGGFPFNETADQARAIAAVRDDLASGRPMDRLIVGDVGYGKTEVAMRAAAIAALSGYQVVLAAPTTVLVRQHLEGFAARFVPLGLKVAGLSRLSSAAEKREVKVALADGSVDIVIGTGAVMGKGVSYKRLGLVIIDEEQRFGAADKARLRGTGGVHLLALSATPIPRTLQSALVGLQEISVIATPPARRQPIRTSIDSFDAQRVRTALVREHGRRGQSFVVVPRIEDMAPLGERLRKLVPELSVVEAHGKMPAAQIDATMVDFADGKGDVLLATNIIEAGLDVPRANTMIVWRADRFGLAQLHQLRGRVGRSNRRGQVLLLTDPGTKIAERTLKRLRTLTAFDRLGAGFDISARDLDMRGAGDLLGEAQAGHVKLIGVDLYQHMLGAALRRARGEECERWMPEIHSGAEGCLPQSWIPEEPTRLGLYVRLARLSDASAIDAFEEELLDRFGPLPDAAETLLAQARLRLSAREAEIARIDAGEAAIALTPRGDKHAGCAKAGLEAKNGRWLLREPTDTAERLERVAELLEEVKG